jgi:hypothetical protein
MINWNKIFAAVYYRFKFCILVIQKGGSTSVISSAFSRYHIEEWIESEKYVIPYSKEQIVRFSPISKAILETRDQKDLKVLEKMYANGVLLGDQSDRGWGIKYATEFHMTADSKLFPPRPQWEANGYRADEYGHWLKGDWCELADAVPDDAILSSDRTHYIKIDHVEDIALPLYEGRMIGQFDFSEKGWVSGKARSAVWREIPFSGKVLEPQFLMSRSEFPSTQVLKIDFLGIGSSTNARSMCCTSILGLPSGHSISVLNCNKIETESIALVGILNSLSYDFVLRCRLGGINLSYFVIEETPLIPPSKVSLITDDTWKEKGVELKKGIEKG